MIRVKKILEAYLFYMKVAFYVSAFVVMFFVLYNAAKTSSLVTGVVGAAFGLVISITVELISTYYLRRKYNRLRQNFPPEHFIPQQMEEFVKLTRELESLKIKIEQGQLYSTVPGESREALDVRRVFQDLERRRNELLLRNLDITPGLLWQILKRLTKRAHSSKEPGTQKREQYAG